MIIKNAKINLCSSKSPRLTFKNNLYEIDSIRAFSLNSKFAFFGVSNIALLNRADMYCKEY